MTKRKKAFSKKEYYDIIKYHISLNKNIYYYKEYCFENKIHIVAEKYITDELDKTIRFYIYCNDKLESIHDLPSTYDFRNGKFKSARWGAYSHKTTGAFYIYKANDNINYANYYLHKIKFNKNNYFLLML